MKFFGLILASLRRHKLRTLLTMLSILVAFLLFGYLAAIRNAFLAGIEVAGADRLVARDKVSLINLMPQSYHARMQRIPGIDRVSHNTWFGGIYQEPRNFFPNMAVNPADLLDMFPEFVLDEEEKADFLSTRDGAIVGKVTAERFGWKVGDRIPLDSPIWLKKDNTNAWNFLLVGIYEGAEAGTDTSQMFFNWEYLNEGRMWGDGMVGWYTLRISEPERAAEIAAAVDAEFANSPNETKTEPEGAFVQSFANQIGDIGFIIKSIVTAVFFTILLVAGNTMAYAVRERTSELAVLKAIGFTDGGVLGLVLGESLFLAAIGGALGLVVAWLLVAAGDPTSGALPVFYIPVPDYLLGILLIFVLAFVAGILPALQAGRLQVADALRR